MSESLILIAIKNAMNRGKGSFSMVDRYSTYYTSSQLEKSVFPVENAPDYLDFAVEDCMGYLSSKLGGERDAIVGNLEIIKELALLEDGIQSGCAVNQLYDGAKGTFHTFMYNFEPKKKEIVAESMVVSFKIRLSATFTVLYNTKKTIFGKRTYEEKQKIPAVISKQTVVDSLSIAFAPYLFTGATVPSTIISELKYQANQLKSTTVSDDDRRTIYDPVKQMNVVVTDPEILALIPPRWITVSKVIEPKVASNSNWEFAI